MPTNFLDLPSELRNDIYEQVIPDSTRNSCVLSYLKEGRRSKSHPTRLGLVLANKRISLEACSVMYATTCFNFQYCDAEDVAAFLTHVGRRNASFISDVILSFPTFRELSRGRVELENDSAAVLAVMREFFKGLRTIRTIGNAWHMEEKLQELGDEGVATEAVGLVDEWFRSLGLPRQIVVELVGFDSTFVRGEMRRRGWKIEEIEDDDDEGCCLGMFD